MLNYSQKNNLKKIILISTIVAFSNSCSLFIESYPRNWHNNFKPRPLTGVRGFPGTESEYGKGFKDGCHTSYDVVTKGILSDINEKKYDFKRMQKSPDYNTGWWDGYEQCTYIMDWDVT